MNEIANTIKATVSTLAAAEQYGLKPNRAGFISCPFHSEKTASLKIYKDIGRGWNCFGCQRGGTVIDFVMGLFELSFYQAVVRINYDFGLNLPLNKQLSIRDKRALKQRQRAIQEKLERKNAVLEVCEIYIDGLETEWARIDRNRRIYAPKIPGYKWHPLFVEALRKKAYLNFLIDTADIITDNFKKDKGVII